MKPDHPLNKVEKLYLFCVSLFCVVVIVSNLITVKLFPAPFLPNLALPAGLITYPVTFFISDFVTEVFGKARARSMIYLGFSMCLITYLIVELALWLPAHENYKTEAFEQVFGLNGLVILSSLIAYVTCQILDVQIYTLLHRWTDGKHLWLRSNGSTLISQFVDTCIVTFILLYWGFKLDLYSIFKIIYIAYLYKATISLCNTPLFYWAIKQAKRYLRVEPQEITLKYT
jgi:queuosine precursor transporter